MPSAQLPAAAAPTPAAEIHYYCSCGFPNRPLPKTHELHKNGKRTLLLQQKLHQHPVHMATNRAWVPKLPHNCQSQAAGARAASTSATQPVGNQAEAALVNRCTTRTFTTSPTPDSRSYPTSSFKNRHDTGTIRSSLHPAASSELPYSLPSSPSPAAYIFASPPVLQTRLKSAHSPMSSSTQVRARTKLWYREVHCSSVSAPSGAV